MSVIGIAFRSVRKVSAPILRSSGSFGIFHSKFESAARFSTRTMETPSTDKIARPLLMIPGPIEFTPDVLNVMAQPTISHVDPVFMEEFGTALENLRKVVLTKDGQPFVLSGSGVLTWDVAVCNLLERGEKALLINTGYFGDRLGECMTQYGVDVKILRPAVIGDVPTLASIESALSADKFKVVTITQVDTSTGVLADVRAIAELVRRVSPDTLIVVDGVCSVGAEELRFDDWGIDAALTASQKAIGVPPGLALLVVSQRALAVVKSRTTPVMNYYGDLTRWLPIMRAYEARSPSYFATPAVNHIRALNVSLKEVLRDGMDARFKAHRDAAAAVRRSLRAMGLSLIAVRDDVAANALSAIKYPAGVDGPKLVGAIKEAGALVTAGLHPDIRTTYFRVGHMGTKSLGDDCADVCVLLQAIETALQAAGVNVEKGVALKAFRGE
eukprot:TRINITY_DN4512_c0_g1_i1.p1 TRINITY_DN4512_c0_g1~~TRINITY_DN4512_c0_g1_i1.p1  ORF type:complete len:442 (-),score=132.85 TRINITY_DN4512_c0_g1_i1:151-1476(-)